MHRYQRLRLFAAVILTTEFVVGFGGALTPRGEIFPFASWQLFSLVPFQSSEYELIIRPPKDGGPPVPLNQAGKFVTSSHSIVAYQLVQQFGRAEEQGDHDLAGRLRQQIEARFRIPGVHYDLVKVTYAPIPRWRGNAVGAQTPVASFTAGEPGPEAPPGASAPTGGRR